MAAGFEANRIINQISTLPLDQNRVAVSNVAIQTVRTGFLLTYGIMGLILIMGTYLLSSWFAAPVEWLGASATQFIRVLQNLWKAINPPDTQDELKTLGFTFSVLTQQIRDEITDLDKKVKARTADLARRSTQLETAALVAQESATFLDIKPLLDETTRLISDRFGYYHVGIFLVDEAAANNQTELKSKTDLFVSLQAANSDGGKRMLARGHKIRIGQGIVGTVAAKNEPRVTSDIGSDEMFFINTDLPQTRCELALPLSVRGRLIGVLDVQSTEPEAFKTEDIKILQTLADQLALAIDNARLIRESQRTLHELEIAYGHEAKQAWENRLAQKPIAYAYNRIDVKPTSALPVYKTSFVDNEQHQMTVPIQIRGRVLGNVMLRRDLDSPAWNNEDLTLVEDAVVQISSALENARLLDEIRTHARYEQLINEVSTQIRSSSTIETILKKTVIGLGSALGASRTFIQIAAQGANPESERLPVIDTNGGKEHPV